jgi:hypothetical protein
VVWVILFGVTIETEVPIRYVLKMGDGDFFACDEYDGVSFSLLMPGIPWARRSSSVVYDLT